MTIQSISRILQMAIIEGFTRNDTIQHTPVCGRIDEPLPIMMSFDGTVCKPKSKVYPSYLCPLTANRYQSMYASVGTLMNILRENTSSALRKDPPTEPIGAFRLGRAALSYSSGRSTAQEGKQDADRNRNPARRCCWV